MAVAGIIRQQACGLGVWCPEEEGEGDEEEEEGAEEWDQEEEGAEEGAEEGVEEGEEEEEEQEPEAAVRTCVHESWRLLLTPRFSLTTATTRPSQRLQSDAEPRTSQRAPAASHSRSTVSSFSGGGLSRVCRGEGLPSDSGRRGAGRWVWGAVPERPQCLGLWSGRMVSLNVGIKGTWQLDPDSPTCP